jgi:hypothetical protein
VQSDGAPLRAHLQRQAFGIIAKLDVRERLLNPPQMPARTAPLWVDFCSLDARRQWTDKGPRPLSWEAIQAWLFVTKLNVSVRYIETIFLLDNTYLKCWYENKKGKSGK